MTNRRFGMFMAAGVLALEVLLVIGASGQPPRQTTGQTPGQSDKMPIEEKFLRLGYMKYEFYNRASNVESARVRQTVHRTADDLRFDIEILKIGLIEEILDIPFSTLATPPKGEVLPAGESTVKETGPNGEPVELVGYPVKWQPGSNPPENFDVPLREALQMLRRAVA